jgi:hypothetical protein
MNTMQHSSCWWLQKLSVRHTSSTGRNGRICALQVPPVKGANPTGLYLMLKSSQAISRVNWHSWSPDKTLARLRVFVVNTANLTCSYVCFHRSVSILSTETSYCGALIWKSTWSGEVLHIFSGQCINRYSRLFSESIISRQAHSHYVLWILICIIFTFAKTYLHK